MLYVALILVSDHDFLNEYVLGFGVFHMLFVSQDLLIEAFV